MEKKIKALFVCGGTGGHIFPALSVADELSTRIGKKNIVFVGNKNGMERKIIVPNNYNMKFISIKGWARRRLLQNLNLFFKVPIAISKSIYILIKEKPDLVFGTGGYVCLPVFAAAVILKKQIYIQEQNSFPGITTKLFSKFAKKIFLAYKEANKHLLNTKETVMTGNPLRQNLMGSDPSLKEKLGIKSNQKVVFVFGGSQGSVPINGIVKNNLKTILEQDNIFLIWQTGIAEYDNILELTSGFSNVKVYDFIDNVYSIYSIANLTISRAGAMTLAELALFGIPSILIPLPTSAGDHQRLNAKVVATANAGVVLEQSEATHFIARTVRNLLEDSVELTKMSENMKELSRADAAKIIADHLEREMLKV